MAAAGKASGRRRLLRALRAGLATLDALQADVLIAGVASDERPLRGAAGYCDWRLNGRLSANLLAERFGGRLGETLLSDSNRRLGPPRIMLVGLGPRAELDEPAVRKAVRRMLVVARKARFERLALEPPGCGVLDADRAVTIAVEVARKAAEGAELTLLCPDGDCLEALKQQQHRHQALTITFG